MKGDYKSTIIDEGVLMRGVTMLKKEKAKQTVIKIGILSIVLLLGALGIRNLRGTKPTYVTYHFFLERLEQQQIKQVILKDDETIGFKCLNDPIDYATDHPQSKDFKEKLLMHNVQVIHQQPRDWLQITISLTILSGAFYMIHKQVKSRVGQGHMALGVAPLNPQDLTIGFKDIAGNIEAKEQVKDIIDFIKTPKKYNQLGAVMPKGIMLYGPPGTGKTLMAKAIATEAGVPFFSVSGSDFIQLYVGVGASRIRELFREARKHEKAVIFIDEIDAIGKKRSMRAAESNDEKDQTLNALLTELSGFKETQGIVVIAATNRLDVIDEALLRPGRFDRHIEIGYPDPQARKAILSLYLKDKPIDETVCIETLTKQTIYFTGAMLKHLVNEAAIRAANANKKVISMTQFDQAFYEVLAGREKKDRSHITREEQRITAYHEAGHALMTKIVAPENKVSKVTIIPSTKGAGGFSMSISKDKMYQTKKDFVAQIQIALAGRLAEEIVFGEEGVTTGASNDIEKATQYVKDYISKYGMDQTIGYINLDVLSGNKMTNREMLFDLCKKVMQEHAIKTKKLLIRHEEKLHRIAEALLEKETLNEEELEALIL